jgi:hypothetical protein
MSQSAGSRIWRAFGLKPHQTEAFKLSPDPQFIDKVRDVLGLYLNPPEAAVVLCVDEKAQIQALDRTAPVLPLMPGVAERRSHDDVRNGTTNLYAALDVAYGKVIAEMSPRHGPKSSAASSTGSKRRCQRTSTCTSCSTTPPPTRRRRSSAGSSITRAYAPLHDHLQLLAEPGRALARRADHEVDQARQPPLRP